MGGMPLASGDAVVAWQMGQESDSGAFVVTRPGEGKLRKWTKQLAAPPTRTGARLWPCRMHKGGNGTALAVHLRAGRSGLDGSDMPPTCVS